MREEYKKYMELVKSLKDSGMSMKEIARFLSESDFESLLGITIDNRNEEEIEKEICDFESKIDVPPSDDDPIKEFKGI